MSTKAKVDAFNDLHPIKYSNLKGFFLRKVYTESLAPIELGMPICTLEIILTASIEKDDYALKITCIGVRDLKIGDLNRMVGIMTVISDISSWGWEGLRYKVDDIEEDSFSFVCYDFETRLGRLRSLK